jgi:DNA invertase Pin-like site-specific DNA recombinase
MKKTDFEYGICEIEEHERFFYSQLSERAKRQYVGLEAIKAGYNGVAEISNKFNVHKHTVRKGKKELIEKKTTPANKIRQKGGGRKKNVCRRGTD